MGTGSGGSDGREIRTECAAVSTDAAESGRGRSAEEFGGNRRQTGAGGTPLRDPGQEASVAPPSAPRRQQLAPLLDAPRWHAISHRAALPPASIGTKAAAAGIAAITSASAQSRRTIGILCGEAPEAAP
jgi:hypothetical protein